MANIGAPEKKISPYFYAVITGCIIALPAVIFLGYLLDLSAGDEGQIQIFELLSNSEEYLAEATLDGLLSALIKGGMTAKATIIGFLQDLSSSYMSLWVTESVITERAANMVRHAGAARRKRT